MKAFCVKWKLEMTTTKMFLKVGSTNGLTASTMPDLDRYGSWEFQYSFLINSVWCNNSQHLTMELSYRRNQKGL